MFDGNCLKKTTIPNENVMTLICDASAEQIMKRHDIIALTV